MAESSNRASPPKAEVDDSPLQRDRNRESLKVKLMLRRPYNQLVAQGIMPPLKTSPAFHEQRKQLERAKTGDLLKAKIQQRPGRDELVRQHILEDVGHVDPSLAERQRMLKKARLADQLNDQLSHRPGPLELIQKNILHTEEPIERAVKEGHIPFKPTCEGQLTKPQHPDHYINYEDDSQSSEGAPSPPVENRPDVLETAAASAGIVTVSLSIPTTGGAVVVSSGSPVFQQANGTEPTIQTFAELCNSVVGGQHQTSQTNGPTTTVPTTATLLPLAPAPSPMSLGSTTSSLSPLSNISIASPPAPPPAAITPRPLASPIATQCQRSDAPGKDKNRKKSKTKSQPKTRTIKFHEYKGPPNAQKSSSSSSSSSASSVPSSSQPNPAGHNETSYEIMLQQQQLFLQWQLECQHQMPRIILPATQKPISLNSPSASEAGSVGSANIPSPAPSNASTNPSEQPPLRPLGKLEDMKVSDLKVELKRRNLPVSGSKPQLIERLKPFTETSSTSSASGHVTQMGHILMDTPIPSEESKSPMSPIKDEPHSPRVDSPQTSEHDDPSSPPSDNIIKEQQKRIKELERQLRMHHQELMQHQKNRPARPEKLRLQHHIQNKMQQQQLALQLQQLHQMQQQQQNQAQLQQLNAKASLAAFLQSQPNNVIDSAQLTAINNKKNQVKNVQLPTAIVLNIAKPTKINSSLLGAIVAQAQRSADQTEAISTTTTTTTTATPTNIVQKSEEKPPPEYDEATKLLKVRLNMPKNHVKSQVVDDVLEILIKNGELPPSAAQDPATPTIARPGMVFTAPADEGQSLVFSPMEVNQGSPRPQPPPPPPLPLATFSVQLPTELERGQEEIPSFTADLLNSDQDIDASMLLSPGSPDPQPPQEVTSSNSNNLDLKELGLEDLDTLDAMDFGQLDNELGVKMETVPQELMDISDMAMDMDDPDWLDSLMPQSPPALNINHHSPPQVHQHHSDLYDPLLANSQDFDLFNMDSDFKMGSDTVIGWDKVDFAT